MKRNAILIAGLFHETHGFLDERTALSDFECSGAGSRRSLNLPGSPMAAAVRRLLDAGAHLIEGPYFFAMPSGMVSKDVVAEWKRRFAAVWSEQGDSVEAIYLVLHGAMVSERDDDVEAEVVAWIRTLPGASELPIYAVLDLHGNISERFTAQMQGFLAYRKNPHNDAAEAAERVADLMLDARASGKRHRVAWRGTNLLWSPSGTSTALEPMTGLESIARQSERLPGIAGVNIFAGYSYADMPNTGVSFSVVAEVDCPEERIEAIFERLTAHAQQHREAGHPRGDTAAFFLAAYRSAENGGLIVAEPSDNIGAGAPGDGTGLLRFFLDEGIENCGVIINDPEAVARLQKEKPGADVTLFVGGRGSSFDPGPVELSGRYVRSLEGSFDLEDPRSHLASMCGLRIHMGACAVFETKGITLLLTSLKTPPFDLGQWRVAGIDPKRFQVIGVKAAVAHRQVYDRIASAHFTLDTPGPCQLDLRGVPYRRIRRPVFPLDSELS